MKRSVLTLILVIVCNLTFGQQLVSGEYADLKLAFDRTSKRITGHFESYTGYDEKTESPRFSCIFYIEGIVTGKKINISTYSTLSKKDDLIMGTLEVVNDKELKIKLPEEHGGCWNVAHFTEEPVRFILEKSQPWIQLRYVDKAKTYFYSDKSEGKRLKAYLVKGDLFYIDKIEGGWAYGSYLGVKVTKGWLKIPDLNKFE